MIQTNSNHSQRPTPTKRRKARRLALQALYQWQLTQTPIIDIKNQFITDPSFVKVDHVYFFELLQSIPNSVIELDEHIKPLLDRSIAELNPVELAILRIGVYELAYRLDIPWRVAIDEALRLAKTFGVHEGFRFVNAVLDKVAKKLRTAEISFHLQKKTS
jgi:N utilization substance protein B